MYRPVKLIEKLYIIFFSKYFLSFFVWTCSLANPLVQQFKQYNSINDGHVCSCYSTCHVLFHHEVNFSLIFRSYCSLLTPTHTKFEI